jgi:hypothetical protein
MKIDFSPTLSKVLLAAFLAVVLALFVPQTETIPGICPLCAGCKCSPAHDAVVIPAFRFYMDAYNQGFQIFKGLNITNNIERYVLNHQFAAAYTVILPVCYFTVCLVQVFLTKK